MSWDLIIPFLKPIEPLLRDPEVTDILVTGGTAVYAEREGRLAPLSDVVISEKSLHVAIRHIARILNDEVNEEQPILDARLPDGSRVAAVLGCCAVTGTTLAIRKFQATRYTLDDLVQRGTVPAPVGACLAGAIERRETLLVSGGTGAGKTTLVNALAALISRAERIVVIEDTAELHFKSANLVRLEARREQPWLRAVTVRDLLRATLRLRPDRIIVGEVRGEEGFDLLQAMNSGHQGTLSTLHANSAADALDRFATLVLMAGVKLDYSTICRQIAQNVRWLVHMERRDGQRKVGQLLRVLGYDTDTDRYELDSVYVL